MSFPPLTLSFRHLKTRQISFLEWVFTIYIKPQKYASLMYLSKKPILL